MRCPRCWRRVDPLVGCADHGAVERDSGTRASDQPPAIIRGEVAGAALAVGGSAAVFALDDARVVKWGRWRDTDLRHRFAHEAMVLDTLDGEVAPRLLGRGTVDGYPYLLLERLHGKTLGQAMIAPLAAPLTTLASLLRAVALLHRRAVIHGDLKPENVVLDGNTVRVLDFGMTTLGGQAPLGAAGGGTLHYQAPEQLAGAAITAATDVYALGAIAFELITGRPPFVGDRPTIEYGHQLGRPPRMSDLVQVSPALDDVITACLAKRPERRPTLDDVTASITRSSSVSMDRPASVATTPRRERGPAALLWVADHDRVEAAHMAATHRGRLVRERSEGTLVAFAWFDHDAPLEAAIEVARALRNRGAAVAVHAAAIDCRRSSGSVRLFGTALERPNTWIPRAPWTGIVITSDVHARELVCEDCATHPGFRRVIDQPLRDRSQAHTMPDLAAREGLLADVTALLDGALADAGPRLVTVIGNSGAGKTRVLDELARIGAVRGWPIIRLAGRRALAGGGDVGAELTRRLGDSGVLPGLRRASADGVVLLVDDAHRVEDEFLDAIITAVGWRHGRLAVVVAATPELLVARPRWGDDQGRALRYELPPLAATDAQRLMRRLLLPAVRVPAPLIERLCERGRGIPGALVAIANELHHRGIVRQHPDSDEWYVAAEELDFIALDPTASWTAARALSTLPAGMGDLYAVVALLGPRVAAADVEAVQARLPRERAAIDADAGLAWLARHGWLDQLAAGFAVTNPAVADAVMNQIAAEQRAAIHGAAYAHWAAQPAGTHDDDEHDRLARVAHHGAGCGEAVVAGHAYLTLARAAVARLAHVEAERLATHAVMCLDGVDAAAAAASRLERARARTPLSRYEAARDDLAAVIAFARGRGDRTLEIDALVTDSAVCDFADWMPEAVSSIEAAAAVADDRLPPPVRARLDNWLGVARLRQGDLVTGEGLLRQAMAVADQHDEYGVSIGARFMLGAVHRQRREAAAGVALLDDALARCRQRGDVFHQTVGLFNRIQYWIELGQPEQAVLDCTAAVELAECHGIGDAEFHGWGYLASVRVQLGDLTGARDAARRSYQLARRRFGKRPPVVASLTLAALEAGHGDHAAAGEIIAAVDRSEAMSKDWSRAVLAAVELLATGALDWQVVDHAIPQVDPEERPLLAWLRSRAA